MSTKVAKGILGEKIGMTQVFDDQSRVIPVTVIKAGPCRVTQIKTNEKDGYTAIQLAFGEGREKSLTKPELGHLQKAGAGPMSQLAEVRLADTAGYELGQEIKADIFVKGERTDVVGVSKGKGFAGVIKRHGFSGLSASHGTERKHRSPGSIGACATPSRVFKGILLPGHMGHERVTLLNLEVVEANPERNLLLLRGAVPGPNGAIVFIRSAVRGGNSG